VGPAHAADELKRRVRVSLWGLNHAIGDLIWAPQQVMRTSRTGGVKAPGWEEGSEEGSGDWERQARALKRDFGEMKDLIDEAADEPRWLPGMPAHAEFFPQQDYHNGLSTLVELWGCVRQMHQLVDGFGEEPLFEELLGKYQAYGDALVRHTLACVSHSAETLSPEATTLSALPQALFQLYAESQVFLRAVDHVWADFLAQSRSEMQAAVELNPAATQDFLALAALLSQLRMLSNHTSSLAWRVAHIAQKEQPHKVLLPEPVDLYNTDIET
jgi:hypothetical protein